MAHLQEMNLLVEVDQPGNQLNNYITKLNIIISQKAASIQQLQFRSILNFVRCGATVSDMCQPAYSFCQQIFEDILSLTDNVNSMLNDWMRNLEVEIPALLEDKIQLLVYAGEYDLIRNWLGNSRWVHAMSWSDQKDFISASNVSFIVDGKEAGILKNHGPLTFIKVHNPGHMVPMDQPMAALKMLELWTTGKLLPPNKGVGAGAPV
ncbi:putative carboxypeptidase C [Helianthus annuus]|uniref:Carboxypeptidase C n=1 Tax=Helianthus annuus TaxID=4232 RepID=A0A9K3NAP2_HELAN|nr:putative carboxypeptidase C [Helianthus annuus]KAJ0527775.1 putative carboxypeptidase C [Helianthus annuus]KAJ0544195.1 putative carboxypeptidase C [Helianthus annuus]KAJ0953613.1 putative carboxypeptidase C [Helianthus annuus]